ncbi:MAG: CBS domain-containing protein, partial [Actinomycetota bacterium]
VDVGEVMTADPATVPADMTVPELREWFRRTRHHGAPVVAPTDDGGLRLVGVVTLGDVAALEDPGQTGDLTSMEARTRELTAGEICTTSPLTVVPEDPVYRAVQRMAALDVGRLPVVDPDDPERLVGLVRRGDVLTAYQRAMSRSLAAQRHEAARRLRDLGGAHFLECVVGEDAPAAGRRVADVDWPEGTVLTSVQRQGDLIVPSGQTVLRPGDEVVALSRDPNAARVERLLSGRGEDAG